MVASTYPMMMSFSFAKSANFSYYGAIDLQCPHHGAKNLTITYLCPEIVELKF